MPDYEELEKNFLGIYDKFKLMFYRSIFDVVRDREGSLSAMEAFSLEVINMLGKPTISRLAEFLNISQSNATYRINSLIKKGYLEKENSSNDRREYYLVLSEKYHRYTGPMSEYEKTVISRMKEYFSEYDLNHLNEMLKTISTRLMPECSE